MSATIQVTSLSHVDYTVACICPMGVELAPVEAMLDEIHDSLPIPRDFNAYTLGRLGQHNVVVAVMPETGNNMAATVATQLVNDFPAVRFALLVGIGGGVPGDGDDDEHDIRLGDVVVSQPKGTFGGVVQYDLGKWATDGVFQRTGHLNKPPAVLTAHVRQLQARHERDISQITTYLSDMIRKWPKMQQKYKMPDSTTSPDQLFRTSYVHQSGNGCVECDTEETIHRPLRTNQEPYIHYGTIGSANVVIKDGVLRDSLRKDMDITCVEMEAAGLMNSFPCLVIRGICDYADSHKNKKWQPYAAAVAAAYMKELMMIIPPHAVTQMAMAKCLLVEDLKTHELLEQSRELQEQALLHSQEQSQKREIRQQGEEEAHCHQCFKTTDYERQKDRNPYRVDGTCRWVLDHPLFQQWRHDKQKTLLWVSADPGCGKSVLAKSLIDHDLRQSKEPVSICYFFFKDNEEQDHLGAALCAILHQLFDQQRHLLRHAVAAWKRAGEKIQHQSLELWRILQTALSDPEARSVICVLDALDECSDSDRQQLIRWLCDLCRRASTDGTKGRLKFLVTSRPYDNVQRWFEQLPSTVPEIRLRGEDESHKVEQEINLVIDQHVKNLAKEFGLSARSSGHFRRQLHNMNHRTYLWLYLAVDEIRHTFLDSPDPDEIRLDGILPTSVEDAYERILQKVRPQQQGRVSKILLIIVGARRPLLTDEMAAALQVSTSEPFKSEHLVKYIREWCGLFIYINHSRLFLIHKTAKDFLLANDAAVVQASGQWKSSLNSAMVEREMGRICVEYLCRDCEDTQAGQQDCFYTYCAEHWASHLHDDEKVRNTDMLGKVLSLCATDGREFSSWFPIRWKAYEPLQQVPRLLDQHVMASHGHGCILDVLYRTTSFDIDARDGGGRTALTWAAQCGHERVIQILLAYDADVNTQDDLGGSALQAASDRGHEQVVQTLLAHGADVNIQDGLGGSALQAASRRGHEQVVQVLLAHGADANAHSGLYGSALQAASQRGHEQVVRLLLAHGADVNAQDRLYDSALQAASWRGHEQVVQILLAHGADANAHSGLYGSALQAASQRGHEQVVQILLAHGADVNIQDDLGGSALQAASRGGHEQIAKILRKAGALEVRGRKRKRLIS